MFIKAIEISNYKSFANSGSIEFAPGINLIAGENNSGKTALLEALAHTWQNKPHVGPNASGAEESSARLTLSVNFEDLRMIWERNGEKILMPLTGSASRDEVLFDKLLNETLDVYLHTRGDGKTRTVALPHKGNEHQPVSNGSREFTLTFQDSKVTMRTHGVERGGVKHDLGPLLDEYYDNIFFFDCHRLVVHTAAIGAAKGRLASNAVDLAAKIQHQHNEDNDRFRKQYLPLVSRVLPQITFVSPSIVDSSNTTLKITPQYSIAGQARHLLSESGTGVGQVLAMLYVIVYEQPSAVVIDEPNSFLHPAATRELLRIFKENTQHQYFISTHSPEVFQEVKPESYTSLKYVDGETTATNLGFGDLSHTFDELGISPFYQRSMWVEGESEVQAFPFVMRDRDVRFFPLLYAYEPVNLADKEPEIDRLVKTYDKIQRALDGEILPTSMRIVVDGEHLPAAKADGYNRRPDKMVRFLRRKMFENYLLDPEAIEAVVKTSKGAGVSAAAVTAKLAASQGAQEEEAWLTSVHGADLLKQIFVDYLVDFRKTEHTVALTQWLANNKPDYFDDLRAELEAAFNNVEQPAAA